MATADIRGRRRLDRKHSGLPEFDAPEACLWMIAQGWGSTDSIRRRAVAHQSEAVLRSPGAAASSDALLVVAGHHISKLHVKES